MERVDPTTELGKILVWSSQQKATDLHTQADRRYSIRLDGKLQRIAPEQFQVPSNDDVMRVLRQAFSSSIYERIEKAHEMDLSFLCAQVRYRANFSKQQGKQSCSFRVVPQHMLKLQDLELPATVADLVKEPRGLLIVTGASGQGKSTTIRALLQRLNETMALRIITIEDPIEYLFEEDKCQFEQREVGVDTESFADGIRNAVRQDPEVIFLGEIRDADSILAAMQAAETGHLVLTTLHADSVPRAIDRIREFYPAPEQANASALLARSLNAMVCQRLIPSCAGKRIPCLEIMKRNVGTQDAIARNDLALVASNIEASVNEGMHSFDQYLMQLFKGGYVTLETAKHYANNWSRVGNGHAWLCALRRRPPQTRRGAMNSPVGSDETYFMYILKLICLTIVNLVKQAWLLPQTVALALQQRRRKLARQEFETERLDRIRNPSKYAGR